jgi:hypothetical protein
MKISHVAALLPALEVAAHPVPHAGQTFEESRIRAERGTCDAQAGINTRIMAARSDNKFAPAQFINYHCALVVANTEPAPATLTPSP